MTPRPPTVALLLPNFTAGGAERQAVLLACHLSQWGWRPVVLVAERHGPLEGRLAGAGIPIHDIRAELWRGKRTARFWANAAGCIHRIRRACRMEGAVVLQSFLYWQNLLAAPAGWLTPGVKAVITGRRNMGEYKDGRPHYQPLENAANLLTAAVVCNARAVARDARRREAFLRGKLHIIRNAVEAEHFARARPVDLRAQYPPLAGASLLVGTVGNLKHQKRHDRFLEAIALARRDNPGIKGLIVGRDLGEEAGLRALSRRLGLEEHVVFTGGMADPAGALRGMDLFLLTSDYEGMPNVVLEAMAAGVAVITTAAGGVREMLRHNVHGRVVEARPEAFAREITLLGGDGETRARLAQRARRRVERHHTPAVLARRHVELYERLTGRTAAD